MTPLLRSREVILAAAILALLHHFGVIAAVAARLDLAAATG